MFKCGQTHKIDVYTNYIEYFLAIKDDDSVDYWIYNIELIYNIKYIMSKTVEHLKVRNMINSSLNN